MSNDNQSMIIENLRIELNRLRDSAIKDDYEVCQILGKALGYPEYPEIESVCVITADHTPVTLAREAAKRIQKQDEQITELVNSQLP